MKNMNIKDKFKIFQWVEVLIWIIILSIVLLGVKHYVYAKHSELKRYQIFLPDVDGLISGSPVRMMGVQIGYVENVNIVDDHVYVKFVLTQPDVTLPKGVVATVEFNGMAGSKSLEIYPPDSTSLASNKLILTQAPKRLNSALGLLCDMFNQLGSMIQKGAYFSDEVAKFMPAPEPASLDENEEMVRDFDEFIDDLSQKRIEFKQKTKERIKNEERESEYHQQSGSSGKLTDNEGQKHKQPGS